MNWYDLPKYYDVSFSHEMQDELAFLKKVFSRPSRRQPVRLLEPACGSGRLIIPLAHAGFDCTGFDQNPATLDYLKKNCNVNDCMHEYSRQTWRILPSARKENLTVLSAR